MVGLWHIGGFQCFGVADSLIKGLRGGKPLNASRNALSSLASKDQLRSWGDTQLSRLNNSSIDPMLKIVAIANLTSIDVDIRQFAMVIADGNPRSINDVVTALGNDARIFVMGRLMSPPFSKAVFQFNLNPAFFGFGLDDLKDLRHDLRLSGVTTTNIESYFEIFGSLDAPTNQNSAYGALHQALRDAGFQITTELPNNYVIGIYNGPEGGRGYLLSRQLVAGTEVKSYGFVMHVKRVARSAD
jgi:hypothetical protein